MYAFKKAAKIKGEGCFCVWKLLFYQQPCAKASEFGIRRILGLYAGFLFYQRLVPKLQKAALFAIVCRFTAFAAFAIRICLRHCVFLCKGTKAPEFGIRRILGQYAGSRFGMFFRL